jgi:hypothetical protein
MNLGVAVGMVDAPMSKEQEVCFWNSKSFRSFLFLCIPCIFHFGRPTQDPLQKKNQGPRPPDWMISNTSMMLQEIKNKVFACRSPLASVNGGVAIQDPNQAKVCRSVLSLMVRQMGKNLLKGGNVMNTSFP